MSGVKKHRSVASIYQYHLFFPYLYINVVATVEKRTAHRNQKLVIVDLQNVISQSNKLLEIICGN